MCFIQRLFSILNFLCTALHQVYKFLACVYKLCAFFLCLGNICFAVYKEGTITSRSFKAIQLVIPTIELCIISAIIKQSHFFPAIDTVLIRFAHNIVINNSIYKACTAFFNLQHNVAVFTVNFAKVHITGRFTKVNTAVSISVSCSSTAINCKSAIFCTNATIVRLQGNSIAANNSSLSFAKRAVQQITLGGNVYTAITGAYVININHIVCVSSNSPNVNIAAVCYSIKV